LIFTAAPPQKDTWAGGRETGLVTPLTDCPGTWTDRALYSQVGEKAIVSRFNMFARRDPSILPTINSLKPM